MVAGIGTDIIEIERIERALRLDGFAERVFTPSEIEYCGIGRNRAGRFAGRFAAKEAVAKSLGGGLSWRDVEILSDVSGSPVVRLSGRAASVAAGKRVLVSISHCRSYAAANAVAVID